MPSSSRQLGACVALVTLAGCATVGDPAQLRAPVTINDAGAVDAVIDGRARFREVFCTQVSRVDPSAAAGCDDLLWHLADEPPGSAAIGGHEAAWSGADRVFVVTGALGDCQFDDLVPFGPEVARLAGSGLRIEVITVGGRSSVAHNAAQIAEALRAASLRDDERVILLGYSKGAVDILQFLLDEPVLASRVGAVVSVAGPIYGSPLADQGAWWYRHFLRNAFADKCDPGDGGVVDSLRPAERAAWMHSHGLPPHVKYFSIAAFTTEAHLSRGLKLTWEMLGGPQHRNDGQVVAGDAVIPSSVLLGFVNADHWDVALPLERQFPRLASRPDARQFPRGALLDAILMYVAEALQADPADVR